MIPDEMIPDETIWGVSILTNWKPFQVRLSFRILSLLDAQHS